MMKILNINSYYYSSTVHRELQLALLESAVDTFTYVPVFEGYKARAECSSSQEEWVERVECYKEVDRLVFYIKHNKILKNIVKKVDIENYDILHAHSLFSNGYIAYKLKQRYNIPYVVAVRNTDVNTFFRRMIHLRKLGNKILINADAIIFLSKPYKNMVIEKYVQEKYIDEIIGKSHVIPNGIDKYWLENMVPPRKIVDNKSIKLLHVGAISKNKNIINTLKACDILICEGYRIKYTAVGKVVDQRSYNEIVNRSYAKHLPQMKKEQLKDIYKKNDILVVPSRTETFGLVYPEAMSQGLPVIYTKGQGFDGQFEDGEVGYSVQCDRPEEIAEAIIKILENYNSTSSNCIKNVEKFRWSNIEKSYQDVYDDFIG